MNQGVAREFYAPSPIFTRMSAVPASQLRLLEQALSDARHDFAAELDKQRKVLERSEERLQGTERRALLEIDRERSLASRAQRELEQLRQTQKDEAERNNAAIIEHQRLALELQKRLGQAEGALQAQKDANEEAAKQLKSSRLLLKEAELRVAGLERELDFRQDTIQSLERQIAEHASINSAAPRMRRRKNTLPPDARKKAG